MKITVHSKKYILNFLLLSRVSFLFPSLFSLPWFSIFLSSATLFPLQLSFPPAYLLLQTTKWRAAGLDRLVSSSLTCMWELFTAIWPEMWRSKPSFLL
ncbi:hypothetical protein RchiOBHm_Chr0c23g0500841 [Rosa chinensis]|uniref:Uncharacterized protein n=1 Tax=Rosa chinensis TaxID=74649 RepID=A0A2P6SQF4_ROSCH|nr:hypothetical protein RchiOBHm_Chr0c23g0500841 [Rosa chinensis]